MAKQTPKASAQGKALPAPDAASTHSADPQEQSKAAKPKNDGTVRVRLLVGRTGFGRAGAVVDYPAADAKRHSQAPFESVELLD